MKADIVFYVCVISYEYTVQLYSAALLVSFCSFFNQNYYLDKMMTHI